jgi:hypothetical protein
MRDDVTNLGIGQEGWLFFGKNFRMDRTATKPISWGGVNLLRGVLDAIAFSR